MTERLSAEHRQRQILTAAVELAQSEGLYHFSSTQVREKAGCSQGLVMHHFTSMIQLRGAVIAYAIVKDLYGILAEAILRQDPEVDGLSKQKRTKILNAAAG
jgi:AcrR family transcriptional regulator